MPAIGAWLVSVFGGLFAWLSTWLGAKAALSLAIVAVSLSITGAFFIAIKALVVGVMSYITYEPFLMVFYALWPANAETCIAACLGADVAAFLYRYKLGLIQAISNR